MGPHPQASAPVPHPGAEAVSLRSRLTVCWYALRGWAIIHGVSVDYGEVILHRLNMSVSGHANIRNCQIWTLGPVKLVGNPSAATNSGNALIGDDDAV
jgi:hypothetical protein